MSAARAAAARRVPGPLRRGAAVPALAALAALALPGAGAALADPGAAASSRQIAERVAGAIRFETVSRADPAELDGQSFARLAAFLREVYPRTHAALRLEQVNDYTLVFEWRGSDPGLQPALFMAHTDVVPVAADARAQWSHPPFAGAIEDGFVWGRGALDVKTGVILWLEAVEALLAEGFQPRRTIYLAFGHDEEVGGRSGAAEVARRFAQRGIRLAFAFDEGGFILDGYPLLPDATVAMVVTAEKAVYTVRLTARGVSGHASMPPPSTAIGRLARAITRVEQQPMPARLTPPLRELLHALAPHLPWGRRLVAEHLWLTGGLVKYALLRDPVSAALVRTTFAATRIAGGVADNVLPERAQATLNVRLLPGDTPQDVLAHLARVIDDPAIGIEGAAWGEAARPASMAGPAFALAADAIAAVLPEAVVLPGLVPGATDSRHFAAVADEVLRFVPLRADMAQVAGVHGRDERIAVAHLGDSVAIAVGMMRRAAAPAGDVAPRSGN